MIILTVSFMQALQGTTKKFMSRVSYHSMQAYDGDVAIVGIAVFRCIGLSRTGCKQRLTTEDRGSRKGISFVTYLVALTLS